MKLKIFTLIVFSFILLSNKGGRNQPSVAAPGDGPATCGQCHGGGNFDPQVTVQLKDEDDNIVNKYVSGTTYTLEVKGSVPAGQTPAGYGFQLVVLDTLENNQAGEFVSYGDNVRNNVVKERNYIMQSAPRADGTFTAEWTAPETNTGALNVYVSILAINGNNNTNGDRVFTTSVLIDESILSNTSNPSAEEWNVSPNPTSGYLNLSMESESLRIYDFSGKEVYFTNFKSKHIDITHLNSGIYFIQTPGQKAKKIIKI